MFALVTENVVFIVTMLQLGLFSSEFFILLSTCVDNNNWMSVIKRSCGCTEQQFGDIVRTYHRKPLQWQLDTCIDKRL